ncbi:MAG: hypothetical protein IJK28_00600 [Clostridia bacterium]|nr:hypothetical protein [Clostridia bacterium]
MPIKKACLLLCCLLLLAAGRALAEEPAFRYRFADAEEAAGLMLANRDYYDNLTQTDLDFRLQKKGATLEELETFAAAQTRDFTKKEKAAVDRAMAKIERRITECGYRLPPTDGIVFIKTTMKEECGAGAYTHGTQVYLGKEILSYGTADSDFLQEFLDEMVAHELFHCLTRNHPDFRAAMYGILGFTVSAEDFAFSPEIREAVISNPDVEHHNAYAAFEIGGEMKNCAVVVTAAQPFRIKGDSFFDSMEIGLVPVDGLDVIHAAEEAANFWDVFGRNTDYVIDPEESLADNFAYTVLYGMDDVTYESPEIIEAMDAYLRRPRD